MQQTALVVSIPISLYLSRPATLESLHSLVAESLPERWTIAVKNPLTIVKLRVQHTCNSPSVDVIVTLCVQRQLTWTLSVLNVSLDPSLNPSLQCFNPTLTSASAVLSLWRSTVTVLLFMTMLLMFYSKLDLLCDRNTLHKDSNLKFIWISHWLKRVSS